MRGRPDNQWCSIGCAVWSTSRAHVTPRPAPCSLDGRMLDKNRAIIEGAIHLVQQLDARAVILAASLPDERALLRDSLGEGVRILSTHAGTTTSADEREVLILPEVRLRRRG